jgi:hypothetical protein
VVGGVVGGEKPNGITLLIMEWEPNVYSISYRDVCLNADDLYF